MDRVITEQAARLADVGLRVPDVTGPELLVDGFGNGEIGMSLLDQSTQRIEKRVEGHAAPDRHVVDLAESLRIRRRSRQKIGLHDVGDVAEIARGLAVSIDHDRAAMQHRIHPARDYRGVGAFRILARPEYVEIAQSDGTRAVASTEHVGVDLVDILGDRIGGQRASDSVLDLGQLRGIAVSRTRRRIDESVDAGVTCRHQHVEEAGRVRSVCAKRIADRSRHRTQRRLMQHDVHRLACLAT